MTACAGWDWIGTRAPRRGATMAHISRVSATRFTNATLTNWRLEVTSTTMKAPCASIVVEVTSSLQLVKVALVNRVALTLEIWAMVAPLLGALVPIQSQPAQAVIDHLHGGVIV